MPLIQVTLREGRGPERIRALISSLTDAVVASVEAPRESVRVISSARCPRHTGPTATSPSPRSGRPNHLTSGVRGPDGPPYPLGSVVRRRSHASVTTTEPRDPNEFGPLVGDRRAVLPIRLGGEQHVPEDQSELRQTPPPPPVRPGEPVRRPVPAARQLALPEYWNAKYTAAVEADLAWRSQREANQA